MKQNKKFFDSMRRILFAFYLILSALSVNAQPGRFHPELLNDEEIIQMQVRDMVSWLDIDGKDKDKFVREYTSFRKEIDGIYKNARPPQDIYDESEIDKAIQMNFEVSEKILQVRKKYYSRFRDFLKPSQIQMMYHIENEAGRRLREGPGAPGSPDVPEGRPKGPGSHGDRPLPPPHMGDSPDM